MLLNLLSSSARKREKGGGQVLSSFPSEDKKRKGGFENREKARSYKTLKSGFRVEFFSRLTPHFLLTKINKFIRRLSLTCTSGRREDYVLLDINRISPSCKSSCTFMCRFFYVSNVASRCCFAFGTFVFFLRVNPLSLFWGF